MKACLEGSLTDLTAAFGAEIGRTGGGHSDIWGGAKGTRENCRCAARRSV